MSMNTSIHSTTEVEFNQADKVRWIEIRDNRGNSLCVFIQSLEQLDLMLEAIKAAIRSFEPEAV